MLYKGGTLGVLLGSQSEAEKRFINVERFSRLLPIQLMAYIVKGDRAADNSISWVAYIAKGLHMVHNITALTPQFTQLATLYNDAQYRLSVVDLLLLSGAVWMSEFASSSPKESNQHYILVCAEGLRIWASVFNTALQTELERGDQFVWYDTLLTHHKVVEVISIPLDALQVFKNLYGSGFNDSSGKVIRSAVAVLNVFYYMCFSEEVVSHLISFPTFSNGEIFELFLAILKPGSTFPQDTLFIQQTLRVLYSLFEKESPCFLDIVARNNITQKHMEEIIRITIGMANGLLGGYNTPITSVPMEAFRLLELLSDDSNFKNNVITGATPLLLRLLSPSSNAIISIFTNPLTSPPPISPVSSAILTYNQVEVMVFLFRIVGNLHCFNEAVSKTEDRGRFLQAVVDVLDSPSSRHLNGSGTTINSKNVLENINYLFVKFSEEDHVYGTNSEELELFGNFADELQKMLDSHHTNSSAS